MIIVVKIETEEHKQTLANLSQAYEAEFSHITLKYPNQSGQFLPDTTLDGAHDGYLLFNNESIPLGFCLKGMKNGTHDIAEFYVIPPARRSGLGRSFALAVFNLYPGPWQVRQIEGAESARAFWFEIINEFTHGDFKESLVPDPHYGLVHCQTFTLRKAA